VFRAEQERVTKVQPDTSVWLQQDSKFKTNNIMFDHNRFLIILITFGLIISNLSMGQVAVAPADHVHKAVIQEVIQTSNYTYLKVLEAKSLQWLAVPSVTLKTGEVCYYMGGMPMTNFKSKELDRTFDKVLFLEAVSQTAEGVKKPSMQSTPEHSGKPRTTRLDLKITPAPGGITIKELLKNRQKYAGKVVTIRGQVTRYNSKILGKNWIHLQDGTSFGEKFDLVATTDAVFKVGDVITLESMVTVDKDFGSGYFFEVILEGAKVN